MKRVLFSVLILGAGLAFLMTGCGKQDEGTTGGQGGDKGKAGVALTFFAPERDAPWENNDFTRFVERKFNVRIRWVVAPEEALKDKKQILLTSREYPEVFLEGHFTRTDLLKFGMQGVLLPLNELIAKYAPNVTKMMEEKPYFRKSITAPDGNIYALPRLNECYHCMYPQKFWINKEWLDRLGLPLPRTTDELYRTLKAFKERDPNGNGKPDEIPLTGGTRSDVWNGNIDAFLMNAFIYNDNDKYLTVSGGKVDFAADKPEWKQGLAYMNRLFREGLIDPSAFTQSASALQHLGDGGGDEVVGSVTTALLSYLVDTYSSDNERQKHWIPVPPLKGPGGVQLAGVSRDASDFEFAITNRATPEQQIAAIQIANYMYSEEGALFSEYGPNEGGGWAKAKPGEKNIEGQQAKYTFEGIGTNSGTVGNDRWQLLGPINLSREFRALFATGQDPLSGKGYGLRLEYATKLYEPYAPKEVYPDSAFIRLEDADKASKLTAAIKEYVQMHIVQFITGREDLDRDWDSYIKGFEPLRLREYVEIYQGAIEQNVK